MEKILKLIKSPNRDDLEIGIALLLALPFDKIMSFFVINGRGLKEEQIEIPVKCRKLEGHYIDLGDNYYFIYFFNGLRLKNIRNVGINHELPVISLKEYLYGEDI